MDNEQIKNFIENSRKAGIKDDKIVSFLQSKGVNLSQPTSQPQQDTLAKSSSIVSTVFPGSKIGEAIGADKVKSDVMQGKGVVEANYANLSPEAKARLEAKGVPTTAEAQRKEVAGTVTSPTGLQVAGDVAQIGAFFLPYERLATGLAKTLPVLGKTGANIASGLAGGYTADVGINLAQGKTGKEALSPGLGTVVGGAIPTVAPLARGVKNLATEAVGVSTGVGSTTLREFGSAIKAGGTQAEEAVKALRGNTTPEQITNTAKSALGDIYSKRTAEYVKSLESLQGVKQSLDVSPIVKELDTQLGKFNIKVSPEGGLDFTRSPLRFNKQAQTEIQTIFDEMKGFGLQEGDRTVIGVDSLKRAFRDLFSDSSEARAFIQAMKKSAENVANTVDGYTAMTSKYAEDTDLITEITKGLSLGDKASTDTAFKKLTTALKTNNEFRKQLVDELNAVSGGKLIPQIAGQQLSETLPRGIVRPLAGVAGGAGLLTGVGILPLLQALVLTSPRAVGEIINALGVSARVGNKIKNILIPGGAKFPGDMILDKVKKTPNKQGGFVAIGQDLKNPPSSANPTTIKNTPKNSISKTVPKITSKNKITDIIDYIRLEKPFSKEIENEIVKLQKKYNIPEGISSTKLADRLENIVAKGLKVKGEIPTTNLISEARKYKSAEEFVKAQPTYYRGEGGSNIAQGKALLAEGKHLASDAEYPKGFGKVGEYVIKPDAKVLDLGDSTFAEISQKLGIPERRYISPKELSDIAKSKGYSVLKYNGEYKSTGKQFTHIVDLTGDSTITKSQLTDMWKKANKK